MQFNDYVVLPFRLEINEYEKKFFSLDFPSGTFTNLTIIGFNKYCYCLQLIRGNSSTTYFSRKDNLIEHIMKLRFSHNEFAVDPMNYHNAIYNNDDSASIFKITIMGCSRFCMHKMESCSPKLKMKKCSPDKKNNCWRVNHCEDDITSFRNRMFIWESNYFALYITDYTEDDRWVDSDDESSIEQISIEQTRWIPPVPFMIRKDDGTVLPKHNIFYFDFVDHCQCFKKQKNKKRIYVVNFINNGVKNLELLRKFIIRGPTKHEYVMANKAGNNIVFQRTDRVEIQIFIEMFAFSHS